ncbi:P-II family nitrogen regulator [Selenomonas sp. TAMA-11512]|uniref:P-II family nitrogen regulator n=1 Tax=Selenomonas sp. TAMA-11512 TaxID=3095337 RepID=UPI00308A270C|nr:P-II family nitrogen regulator [Selenomonas sp. TAMA-11512]
MALTKIEIITRANKLDELIAALNDIGVLGLTVTQVFGSGLQRGQRDGKQSVEINLLPKIKVETVICEIPVKTVMETAQKVLKTGKIGDGKIFVYNMEDAMRIRTGDCGEDAIRDINHEEKD